MTLLPLSPLLSLMLVSTALMSAEVGDNRGAATAMAVTSPDTVLSFPSLTTHRAAADAMWRNYVITGVGPMFHHPAARLHT